MTATASIRFGPDAQAEVQSYVRLTASGPDDASM